MKVDIRLPYLKQKMRNVSINCVLYNSYYWLYVNTLDRENLEQELVVRVYYNPSFRGCNQVKNLKKIVWVEWTSW